MVILFSKILYDPTITTTHHPLEAVEAAHLRGGVGGRHAVGRRGAQAALAVLDL